MVPQNDITSSNQMRGDINVTLGSQININEILCMFFDEGGASRIEERLELVFGDWKKRSMNFIQSSVRLQSNTIEEKEHKGIILDRVDCMDHQANHCRAFFFKRGCINFEKGVQF